MLDEDTFDEASEADARYLTASQIFGEVVELPEPFSLEIPTIKWKTWADDEF